MGFRNGDNHQNPVVYKANRVLVPRFAEKRTVTLRHRRSSIPITMAGGALLVSDCSLGMAEEGPRHALILGQPLVETRRWEHHGANAPVATASPRLPHRRLCCLIHLHLSLRFSSHFMGK